MDNVWFSTTVHAAFGFLIPEYGFSNPRVTNANGTLEAFPPIADASCHYPSVIYEKQSRFIKAAQGGYGFEFDLILGFCRYSESGRDYRYTYIENLLAIVAPNYTCPTIGVSDYSLKEKFTYWINASAQALRLHGKRFFQNDPKLWIELEDRKRELIANYRMCEQNKQLRCEALAAFESHNWQQVVTKYQAVSDSLTPPEAKRLQIARKRIGLN